MAENLKDDGWKILYYNLTTDDLSDPVSKQHLPKNGKRYEVELYDHELTKCIGTCFARYEEHFDLYGVTNKLIRNNSKWFETMPDHSEREVTDKVLRFREIQ